MAVINLNIWRSGKLQLAVGRDKLGDVTSADLQSLFSYCIFMSENDKICLERGVNTLYECELSEVFKVQKSTCIEHLLVLAGTNVTEFYPPALSVSVLGSISGTYYNPDLLWAKTAKDENFKLHLVDRLPSGYLALAIDHVRYTRNMYIILAACILNQRFSDPEVWTRLFQTSQHLAMYTILDFIISALNNGSLVPHLYKINMQQGQVSTNLRAICSSFDNGFDVQVMAYNTPLLSKLANLCEEPTPVIPLGEHS